MPIFGMEEEVKSEVKEKESMSVVPNYESEAINNSLITIAKGSKWKVTYLHRLVDNDNDITIFDPNIDITLFNYIRINDLTIRLESPLPVGIPDDLKASGIIDVDFTPTVNDLILAKLPDGRLGIYVVTAVDRFNYNNQYLFRIEFQIFVEADELDDPYLNKLLKCVVDEYYYNDDFRLDKSTPMYTPTEKEERETLLNKIELLTDYYINTFSTKDTYYYIGYKKDGVLIVDLQIQEFIRNVIGIDKFNINVSLLPINDKKISIFDFFVRDNISPYSVNNYYTIYNPDVVGNPYVTSIPFLPIGKVIDVTKEKPSELEEYEDNELFPKIRKDYYIFDKAIYELIYGRTSDKEFTKLEGLIADYLTGNTLDYDTLIELSDSIYLEDIEEQYYYIPVLVMLMVYYVKTFTIEFV